MRQFVPRTKYREMCRPRNSDPPPKLVQPNSLIQSVGRDGVQLIEETMALREMMMHESNGAIVRSDTIRVLNRADRSAAFLAAYSSRFMDCPVYMDDAPARCILTMPQVHTQNAPNTQPTSQWDCLGLSFSRGVPCEQLWPIFIQEKSQQGLSLFDMP